MTKEDWSDLRFAIICLCAGLSMGAIITTKWNGDGRFGPAAQALKACERHGLPGMRCELVAIPDDWIPWDPVYPAANFPLIGGEDRSAPCTLDDLSACDAPAMREEARRVASGPVEFTAGDPPPGFDPLKIPVYEGPVWCPYGLNATTGGCSPDEPKPGCMCQTPNGNTSYTCSCNDPNKKRVLP